MSHSFFYLTVLDEPRPLFFGLEIPLGGPKRCDHQHDPALPSLILQKTKQFLVPKQGLRLSVIRRNRSTTTVEHQRRYTGTRSHATHAIQLEREFMAIEALGTTIFWSGSAQSLGLIKISLTNRARDFFSIFFLPFAIGMTHEPFRGGDSVFIG